MNTEFLALAARDGKIHECPCTKKNFPKKSCPHCAGKGLFRACPDCLGTGWDAAKQEIHSTCEGRGTLPVDLAKEQRMKQFPSI